MTSGRIPDTPAGARLSWLLGALRDTAEGRMHPLHSDDDNFAEPWHGTDEALEAWWRDHGNRVGRGSVIGVEEQSPLSLEAHLDVEGRRWIVGCEVERPRPHRITFMRIRSTLDGLAVRLATATDSSAMTECELQCPMVLGNRRIYVDRGHDWFAANRVVGDAAAVAVGELDGRILGIYGAVALPMRIAGIVRHRFSPRHLRMLPETQGTGIWRSLTGPTYEALAGRWDGPVSFISPYNEATQRTHATAPNKWSIQPVRAVVEVAEHAGPPAGRVATPKDAAKVVEILNTCHEDEEGYVPYTSESLTARLSRAPDMYSWDRLWITDRAAVGVWPSGKTTRWIIEEDGRRSVQRRALVVDHGFLPDGADDFEALVRAWCSRCTADGLTHLTVFTSKGSPGYRRIATMAADLEPFDMWTHDTPEPDSARERGLYIDQLYF